MANLEESLLLFVVPLHESAHEPLLIAIAHLLGGTPVLTARVLPVQTLEHRANLRRHVLQLQHDAILNPVRRDVKHLLGRLEPVVRRDDQLHALLSAQHQLLPTRRDEFRLRAHLLAAEVALVHHALRPLRHFQRVRVCRLQHNAPFNVT